MRFFEKIRPQIYLHGAKLRRDKKTQKRMWGLTLIVTLKPELVAACASQIEQAYIYLRQAGGGEDSRGGEAEPEGEQVMEQVQKFEEWALLELFGHQRLAGRVTEATIAGGAFVRVDVPDAKGRTVLTKYLNPSAIYGISPCDENVAVAAAQRIDAAPIRRYQLEQLATTRALPYEDGEES